MKDLLLKVSVILAVMASFSIAAKAQFKEEAFSQSYVDPSDTTGKGEVDQMWTFKEFFNGVAKHDSTLRIGSFSLVRLSSSEQSSSTTGNTGRFR